MSHMVSIKTRLACAEGIAAACRRLGLQAPEKGEHGFMDGNTAKGLVVKLDTIDSTFIMPLVVQENGELAFDNYKGKWGSLDTVDRFVQAYAVEMVHLEAHRQGHYVTEQPAEDGSIMLEVLSY